MTTGICFVPYSPPGAQKSTSTQQTVANTHPMNECITLFPDDRPVRSGQWASATWDKVFTVRSCVLSASFSFTHSLHTPVFLGSCIQLVNPSWAQRGHGDGQDPVPSSRSSQPGRERQQEARAHAPCSHQVETGLVAKIDGARHPGLLPDSHPEAKPPPAQPPIHLATG